MSGSDVKARVLPDLIDSFLEYTDGIPSPEIFRLWSAIATIAGALERRVWIETARSTMYPNLYTLLVAPPGVGKSQAIMHTNEIWYATKKLHVAPSNVTKAALIDSLQDAGQKVILDQGKIMVDYHSLVVAASEFGVLVPAHDLEFLSVLNDIYDNPKNYRERRRSLKEQPDIAKPQINILAGTQPAYLASLLPEEAWGMGFTSRILMIYSSSPIYVDLFKETSTDNKLLDKIVADVVHLTTLYGRFRLTPEAEGEIARWHKAGMNPIPEHTKLEHYISRRVLHLLKLCMVSSAARSSDLLIELSDVSRARDWLLAAEQTMPDIFRAMVSRSDTQVIQELHFFLWQLYAKEQSPIHETRLVHFLSTRIPSDKINKILEIASRANIIARSAGTDAYVPRAKTEHGLE